MIYRPVNAKLVTQAVVDIWRQAPLIGGAGVTIQRSEKWEDLAPWIGVYRERQRLEPRVLGAGAGFRRQRIELICLVRQENPASGEACEDMLEDLIQNCVGELLTDTSLKGTVETLAEEFDIMYDGYDKAGSVYVQTAVLRFAGLVNVRLINT